MGVLGTLLGGGAPDNSAQLRANADAQAQAARDAAFAAQQQREQAIATQAAADKVAAAANAPKIAATTETNIAGELPTAAPETPRFKIKKPTEAVSSINI